ncbi:uncharacterized protein [Ptychodera flava]|uniref:uncharacterized protein n=1 Tax=Ptychodera flava TaxID=63121 RepID=UPI00396A2791
MEICQLVSISTFLFISGLRLGYSQSVTTGPSNTEYVSQSQSATFNCSVSWSNDPTDPVVWGKYEDGGWTHLAQFFSTGSVKWVREYETKYTIQLDPPFTVSELTVLSATLSEDGIYDCYPYSVGVPTMPHGKLVVLDEIDTVSFVNVTSDAVLKVNASQEYQVICEGISGNPPAELKWTIGDNDVTAYSSNTTSQHRDVHLFDSRSILRYTFSVSDDNLQLTCTTFQNEDLAEKSVSVRLNVVEFRVATTVVGPSNTEYTNVSDSVSFSCNVDWGSDMTDSVVWAKRVDDKWLQICQFDRSGATKWVTEYRSSYEVTISGSSNDTTSVLEVVSATLDEDAEYDCYPYSLGEPPSPHARLVVLDQIDSIVIDGYTAGATITVNASQSYQLTCEGAAGNPQAELSWFLGDVDVTDFSTNTTTQNAENAGLYDSQSVLEYVFNSSDDSQILKCQSFQHSALRSNSTEISLNVLYKPVIHDIVILSWKDDNSVTLECIASANPDDVTYGWSGEGGRSGGNSRTWLVKDDDRNSEITVTCNASNEMGEFSLTRTLKDPHPPACDRQCIVGVIVGLVLTGIMFLLFIFWSCTHSRRKKAEKVPTNEEC